MSAADQGLLLAALAGVGLLVVGLAGRRPRGRVTPSLQLSPHVQLRDLIGSETATARGLDNTPGIEEIGRLTWLSQAVIEPIWTLVGPIRITSGYRTPALNAAVDGSETSDHLSGLAFDFVPLERTSEQAFDLIRSQLLLALPLDQVAWYPDRGHVHIGARISGARHAAYVNGPSGWVQVWA